jgi:hypothetical protein
MIICGNFLLSINNKDFYEGNAINKSTKPFDYKYQILNGIATGYDRLISSSKRIEESGIGNKMILNVYTIKRRSNT